MTRAVFSILLLLVLTACGKSGNSDSTSSDSSNNEVSLDEIEASSEVPNEALTFETNILTQGFDKEEEDKIQEAAELIKKVVASQEFKEKILKHTYKGKKTFIDNGGLSNSQIYKKILEGAETLNPTPNNTMDLQIILYSASNNTVGYTYPREERIWMNNKYFKERTSAEVTTNMMHEWLHKLGFKHSSSSTPSRPYSVPYAVGYLMRDLAKK